MDTAENNKTTESFDVYISHADDDRDWVEEKLLPRLTESQIVPCVSFLHFEPGARMIDEVEKAVRDCHKTLLILTPSYLEYEWGILESMKVLDRQSRLRKFIPIVLKSCELPLNVKSIIYLDFTFGDLDKLEKQWNRLIKALKQSQQAIRGENGVKSTLSEVSKTKYFRDVLLQAMEEKLRMDITKHWIQTGFELPEDQFSFTVVFFECQIEILERLEGELNLICDQLDHGQINMGSNIVQQNVNALLELIKIRTEQLSEVLNDDIEHELGITIGMSLQRLMINLEAIRSRSIKLQIGSLLQPMTREKESIEFRTDLYAVLLSLGDVLKYSRQIRTNAKKEWSSVMRDD